MRQTNSFTRRQFLTQQFVSSLYEPVLEPAPQHQGKHIPNIHQENWGLILSGMVINPQVASYADLGGQPQAETACVIACEGSFVGHAVWQGAKLTTLLNEANLHPQARYARFDGADGYSTSIALEHLQNALLAYQMNRKTLSAAQGFPLRLIVPGLYGYKLPKWLMRIEISSQPYAGYWERHGKSQVGIIKPNSLIFTPHPESLLQGEVHLSGAAYSGLAPVSTVELSIDDGPWLSVPIMPGPWTRWAINWTPPVPADYLIKIRATDQAGNVEALPKQRILRIERV